MPTHRGVSSTLKKGAAVGAAVAIALATAGLMESPVEAQATGGGQASSAADHLVVDGQPAKSRLLWKFKVDGEYALAQPAVGPDGTIYLVDVDGHLHAISPDGQQKWVLNGAGESGVDVGPDGTIYTGNTAAITAVNPDGTVKWRFQQDPIAFILLGPSVGPDGNIYAVATSGLGVFSLTPGGVLRWNIPEPYDREIEENQELAFGPAPGHGQQLYFHANHHFRAVRLNGHASFTIVGDGRGSCGDGAQPVVGPNGDVYTTNWTIGVGAVLGSYDPSGSRNWTFVQQPNNCSSEPDVGPDGRVFIVWNQTHLFAMSPGGRSRELAVEADNMLNDPAVSPGGDQVVMTGLTFSHQGLIESFNARNGKRLWIAPLPDEAGATRVPMSSTHATFSPDGQTAYMTAIVSGVYDHSWLYAVDVRR